MREHGLRRIGTTVAAAGALLVAGTVGYAVGRGPDAGPDPVTAPPVVLAGADLTTPTDCADLLDSYVERGLDLVGPWGWGGAPIWTAGAMEGDMAVAPQASGAARSMPSTTRASSSGTGTTVQEAGVDESDVVKTAGSLLLRLREGVLLAYDVSGARPVELSSTAIPDARGTGSPGDPGGELVLVGSRAVVVGTSDDGPATTLTTVDLADPTSPAVVDATTYVGRASAVRVHGDVVRVVLQTGLPALDFTHPDGRFGEVTARLHNRALVRATTLADWLPTVDGAPVLDCTDVAVPDDDLALGTTTVVALDPAAPTERVTTAVATDTTVSYFSADRFYLAATPPAWGWTDCLTCRLGGGPVALSGTTPLFAFALDGTATTPVASGEVEGTVADRWSLDAVGGSLRVAVGASSQTGDWSSVVTLREDEGSLVEDGRVDRLGEGEQLKSVRWFDDLAIVVTFRQVDPLYAVDLTEPSAPRLLGELEVPGFSEYLHPLGEHRLLGLGQDASAQGELRGAQAALFDVTDLTRPRQLDVVHYAPGTWAGAATDPRQLTWLPEQRVVLTVVGRGWGASTGWVSVLSLDDGTVSNRMVEVEHGTDVAQVRLVPLASGRVALVTGEDVTSFDVAG